MACHANDVLDLRDMLCRREIFRRIGTGVTGMALATLLQEDTLRAAPGHSVDTQQGCHFPPKAKAVIQLFQHGGPSHMDLLDPKPELNRRHNQPMPKWFTGLVAISRHGNLLGSPYRFLPSGECGVPYSEILPHTSTCADDIAVVRSMYSEHNNHEQALWLMHTGRTITGRPTMGAWVNYALGSANKNLPAYVVLRNDSKLPVDGPRNWSSGFLPPRYQGVHFRHTGAPILHLKPDGSVSRRIQQLRFRLLQKLNGRHRQQNPSIDPQLEARISSYELAARMQVSASEALDVSRETKQTQALYGIGGDKTDSYARRCLMARRLVERGVRFVQILIRGQMWDTHADNARRTKVCCQETDQPTAALLKDLKQRGLLESTLVMWGGEFGRTPVSQAGEGRDHHKQGFSLWLAGGGIKGGQAYGATDELGYHAVENRVKVSDLHATILHLLGLDHQRLEYLVNLRPERLTDVYDAQPVQPLIA